MTSDYTDGFWLHFWYLQIFSHYFVCLSLIFIASDYTFDIFKPLTIILSIFLLYLWLLIATLLISSNHWPLFCLSFSYIYGFWLLHFWYLQTFGHYFVCLSLIFMTSDYYTFDIFKPLAIILSVFLLYLWLLITTLLISSNHWPLFCLSFSYIYGFWLLHFWYLQTFGHYFVCLSLIFMASDYTFDIFKPLAIILSVFLLYLWLLITTLLISSNLRPLFCLPFSNIYGFWLHFWYLQTFGHYFVCLSVIFMASDYTFDIFKLLAIMLCVFLLYLWLQITLLISSNLWPLFCLSFSYIYGFWLLHFWYLQTFDHYFVCLSLIFMASDYYTFDIFKPLAIILSVFLLYLWLLITTLLISSSLRPLFCLPFSNIYGFWLHFWYLQTFGHYFVCLSLIFMASDYTFDIFKPLAIILSVFLLYLWLLITLLISSNLWSLWCLSFSNIYGFWLHFWYVQTFGHYFVCLSVIFMASDYTFDIFNPLAIILSVFLLYLWLLIATLLISSNDWPLFCVSFSYIYGFWLLHFWYLQALGHYFVCLSLIFMASDYTFDIFKPLAIILSVFLLYLWLLITLLISSNLWPLFCLSFCYIYGFWLHFWYLQTFGHYVVCLSLIFMASDYTFDMFKYLAIILSVFLLYLWLLITLLISSIHWPLFCLSFSYIYGFWLLHFWYLQTTGHYFVCLSLIFMASDYYTFDIFKPLAIILYVFLLYLWLLITTLLISSNLWPLFCLSFSYIYDFWFLHFWYLQTIGHYLSVFLLYLWLQITLLISSNLWPLFCLSFSYIYGFWLHFWYLQTFGHYFVCLSVIFMASDYTFDIFKPLGIMLSVFLLYLWLLITTLLISSSLRPLFCLPFSNIYGFWLHFWYLQTFGHYVVCLSLIFMASDYTFDIFKPLTIILSVFLLYLWLLITTLLLSSNLWPLFCLSFSYIYGFWLLHFWYLQTFDHYFVCLSLIFMASDYYTFDIFKP